MKKVMVAAFVLLFIVGTASVGFSAKPKCSVDAVDGDTVTVTCADEEAVTKLKAEDKIKFDNKVKCVVTEVGEGFKVISTCEDADKLKAGDEIKMTLPKKGSVEGC